MGGILGRRAWEQSNGRLWLPSLHYDDAVQMGFCCCTTTGCDIWSGSRPSSVLVDIASVTDGACDECEGHNRIVECDWDEAASGDQTVMQYCCDTYVWQSGDTNVVAAFYHFYGDGFWRVNADSYIPSSGCSDSGGSEVSGYAYKSARISSGDYTVNLDRKTYQLGGQDRCSLTGVATVTVP